MPKAIKFGIAKSGTLVYRSSGNAYRGEYTLKESSNGRITVYGKDGRKIGTVGKGTAKEQKLIADKDRRNFSKRKKANLERRKKADLKAGLGWASDVGESYSTESFQAWSEAKRANDFFPRDSWKKFEISFEDQRKMNFGSALQGAVEEGKIDINYANEMWEKYKAAPSGVRWDETRNDLWDQLMVKFDEVGYIPSG